MDFFFSFENSKLWNAVLNSSFIKSVDLPVILISRADNKRADLLVMEIQKRMKVMNQLTSFDIQTGHLGPR